jgi:citrate synthase
LVSSEAIGSKKRCIKHYRAEDVQRLKERAEVFLLQVEASSGDTRKAIVARLRRGERIPGFGRPLYPGDDSRGVELLRLTTVARPDSPAVALTAAVESGPRTLSVSLLL